MLTKRIIACLDCVNGRVIKGVQFQNHEDMGLVENLAEKYSKTADELVLYNIASSAQGQTVNFKWVRQISKKVNIPFCVAGGIRTINDAKSILNNGADKISINTPALENPSIINEFSKAFGRQAVVIGIDTKLVHGNYVIYKNTGKVEKTQAVQKGLEEWILEVQDRGCGEIVINSIAHDGMKNGYEIPLLERLRKISTVPIIASGGAGTMQHFADVFQKASVDGALSASIFHKNIVEIPKLKSFLKEKSIPIRI